MAKRADEFLRDELDDEHSLLALVHDAVIVRSLSGAISFWNRGAEETYGWKSSEVLGRVLHDLLGTSSPYSSVVEESLRSHGAWEGEMTQIRKDGSEVVVASRQALREHAGRRPVTILEINRDITEVKRAQDRLKESEERFRLMVEGVRDHAMYMLNADGAIMSWNSGAERMNRYQEAEVLGRNFSLFYPTEDVEAGKPADALRRAAVVGHVADEGWRVRKDGSRFWARVVITAVRDPPGALRGFVTVTRDFTERRQFEEQLEDQARLLDYVHDAVVAIDENRLFTAWNAGAERLYGWRADEVIGKLGVSILGTEMSDRARENASRALQEDGVWRGEAVQRHKDGRRLHIEAATMRRGGPNYALSVNRDIGELRRALVIEERSRIARELHDSVSQALFSMTLQSRALELALEGEGRGPDDPVTRVVADVRRLTRGALAEMRSLIFELRPDALAEEGLGAALSKYASGLEAKLGLTVQVSLPSEQVTLDPKVEENLYRLALEAVNNVVKHAQASTVHIRLAGPHAGSRGIELEITDDGIGFDTSQARPGHLGLTTMAERAAAFGGTLEVTSAPGGGTTVRASLAPGRQAAPS